MMITLLLLALAHSPVTRGIVSVSLAESFFLWILCFFVLSSVKWLDMCKVSKFLQ